MELDVVLCLNIAYIFHGRRILVMENPKIMIRKPRAAISITNALFGSLTRFQMNCCLELMFGCNRKLIKLNIKYTINKKVKLLPVLQFVPCSKTRERDVLKRRVLEFGENNLSKAAVSIMPKTSNRERIMFTGAGIIWRRKIVGAQQP